MKEVYYKIIKTISTGYQANNITILIKFTNNFQKFDLSKKKIRKITNEFVFKKPTDFFNYNFEFLAFPKINKILL